MLREVAKSSALLLLVLGLTVNILSVEAFNLRDMIAKAKAGGNKRDEHKGCPDWQPFQCPIGDCVPIKYLCDGSADCRDSYDENESMCTAATRPPVEETASFLSALLTAHGQDFLVKLFGKKAAKALAQMGGVAAVSVALSESKTAKIFGKEMGLTDEDVNRMVDVMRGIIDGTGAGPLTEQEAADFTFFVQQLHETNFF